MNIRIVTLAVFVIVSASPAFAGTGDYGRTSDATGQGPQGTGGLTTADTAKQLASRIITGTGRLAPIFAAGGRMRNGLPATNMDSFVFEAGGQAELIYGDEGVVDIPPYFEFTKEHRINTGIYDDRDKGLTTGHGSYLPDAWGADEFIGDEWDQSGSSAGNAPMLGLPLPTVRIPGVNVPANINVGPAQINIPAQLPFGF
jgi:hypothetical protein